MTTHIDGTRPIDDEICATCFACGRGYCKGDGRFCSTRCREAFDAGFPPAQDSNYSRAMTTVPLAAWRVVAGPPGIEIGATQQKGASKKRQAYSCSSCQKNVGNSPEKTMGCSGIFRIGRCPQKPPGGHAHERAHHRAAAPFVDATAAGQALRPAQGHLRHLQDQDSGRLAVDRRAHEPARDFRRRFTR